MKTKVNFHNLGHTDAIEEHALKKLHKLEEFYSDRTVPFYAEMWLKAESSHPHHQVDLQVRAHKKEFFTSSQSRDLYVAIDEAVDKMVTSLKKAKAIELDKHHQVETDKRKFEK